MAFDPSTAKPVSFDPATAKPYKPSPVPSKANDYNVFGYANAVNNPALNRDIQIAKDAVSAKSAVQAGALPAVGPNPMAQGVGDAALSLLSSMFAPVGAGVVGLGDLAANKLGLTNESPATAIQNTEQALTYQPRTILGHQLVGAASLPFRYLAELGGETGQAIMNPKQSLVPSALRPAAATAANTAIQALPFMLGGKAGDATEAAPKTAPEAPITPEANPFSGLMPEPKQLPAPPAMRVTPEGKGIIPGTEDLRHPASAQAHPGYAKQQEPQGLAAGLVPKDSQKTAPVAPEKASAPVNDTMAQVNDLKAPDSKRQAVFIPKADVIQLEQSGNLHNVLKSGTPVDNFDGQGGILLAKTPEIAQEAIKARDDGTPPDQVIGNLTQSSEAVKPPEPQKPPESAANVPPETQPTDLASMSQDSKDLIAQHNLSSENVLHAEKLGGLAVPSVAITHVDRPITGFGDISLLGNSDLINPRSGAKVFGSDAYSPRHPRAEYRGSDKQATELNKILTPFRKKGDNHPALYSATVDDLVSQQAFHRYLAKELGIPDRKQTYSLRRQEAEKLLEQVGVQPRIFQGFTYSGNRRYTPYTLDNVVKEMKKEMRGGESNSNIYGAGQVRAGVTPLFRSLKAIREDRGRLVSKEDFEKVKEEVNNELLDLASKVKKTRAAGHNQFMDLDHAVSAISDAPKYGVKRAMELNGFDNVPAYVQDEIRQFLDKLRNLPTEYFEAILPRAVHIGEFHTAVVPHNAPKEVVQKLRDAGLKIRRYDKKGDNPGANRAATIKSAVSEKNGTLFSSSTDKNPVIRTPEDILDELRASGKTGQQIADLAGKNGLVELHPNMVTADLNIHPSMSDQAHLAGGVYSPRTDTIKLMSENIPQGNALGVALHEMTHARLKDLMGEKEYDRAIWDIMDLADKGDPVAKAAMDRIPENTPVKSKGDELLAYTVQEAVDRGATKVHGRIRQIVMRLLNALRTRIASTKFYKAAANRGVRLKITPEALAAYARRAVELEHSKQGINAPESGAAEPLYSIPKDLSDHEKLLSQAKDAISKGAPLDAVHAILKERGVDPALLGTHGMDRPEQIANPVSPKVDLTEEDYSNLVKATKQGFVGKVKAELKDFDRVWQKYFPRLDTEQKKIFAGVIQRAFSRKEIHEAQLFQKLWDLRGEFAKMGEAGNIAWRDKFQKGDKSLPHAKFVRDVLQKLYHAETEAGATMGYRENYFPDKYDNQRAYESWVEKDFVSGHKAGFQKEKLFPTISEAMQAGFKPLYPNVMDALMVRVHEDGIIRSRLQVLNDLMRMGHIRPYPETPEEVGQFKLGPDEQIFTTTDFGRYAVPSQASPILENGLFAHSWWEEDSPTGKIFRGWMRFKNPVIAGRLGASAYHLTHEVLGLRSANGMANAFDAYRRGVTKPAIDKFVKSLMLQASSLGETNPHSLIRIRAALVGGHEYLPALVKAAFPKEKLGEMTDEERTIFKMIVEGGLPIELSREYRSDVAKLMKAAFQDKKVAKGAMLLPFATLRATQVPIMDWVVPNLKILAYIDGARQILHAHPDLMDNEPKRLKLLGELTRNVEKRFGQMSYDRLFWNKRFKEVMQGTFLSFSWNYGFLNQFGGGLKDMGKGALMLPFKEGRKANPIFTNRAAFALSYTTTAMALAGLMHWYFSGKAPTSIKDLVYPVCGHDAQGAEIRCTTPYFTRDMGSLYFHTKRNGPISGLANEAVNKLSPVLSMLGDQIRNENYYGQQISDPYASLGAQVAQRAKAFADSFVPISVEGAKRGGNFGLAFAGFNPAPKYATEGDTLAAIYDAYDTYVATTKPYPEALQAHAWKNLRELYQSGDMEAFKRQLSDDIKKYQWSSGSVNGFLKSFSEPQGFHIFSELPPSVKRHIFLNVMNGKERAEYWKAFGRSGFKGATPKEAQEIMNLHKEAAHG